MRCRRIQLSLGLRQDPADLPLGFVGQGLYPRACEVVSRHLQEGRNVVFPQISSAHQDGNGGQVVLVRDTFAGRKFVSGRGLNSDKD